MVDENQCLSVSICLFHILCPFPIFLIGIDIYEDTDSNLFHIQNKSPGQSSILGLLPFPLIFKGIFLHQKTKFHS